jgi:hypothetical protein
MDGQKAEFCSVPTESTLPKGKGIGKEFNTNLRFFLLAAPSVIN